MFTSTIKQLFLVTSVLFISITLSACGPEGQTSADQSDRDQNYSHKSIVDDDTLIMDAIYLNKRIPENFYNEINNDYDVYYITKNVQNVDLLPLTDRLNVARYELSTNDFTEAFEWSEKSAENQPVYRQLVDNTETDLYFEFTRVDISSPQFVYKTRVLKSSVIDRSGVDLNHPEEPYKGNIKTQLLTTDLVKKIVEYFWTFSYKNNAGNAVLSSSTIENNSNYIHTMVEAALYRGVDNQCDIIEVSVSTYDVDRNTGDIWMNREVVREISSVHSNGVSEICINNNIN